MTTQHTPGPWHVGMKPGPIIYGPKGEWIADIQHSMLELDENRANVALIASAPGLLAERDRLKESNAELREVVNRMAPWLGKVIADGSYKNCANPNDAIETLKQARAALERAGKI